MKKKSMEGMRLALHKETLRMLETPELQNAAGGVITNTDCQSACAQGTMRYCCYEN